MFIIWQGEKLNNMALSCDLKYVVLCPKLLFILTFLEILYLGIVHIYMHIKRYVSRKAKTNSNLE
jgi:hypothetical protein